MESNAPLTATGAVPPSTRRYARARSSTGTRSTAYLRGHIAGARRRRCEVLQFPNGSANLTYLVRVGDTGSSSAARRSA